jgi:hypothetical protein
MDREQPSVCEEKHLQFASFDAVAQRRQHALRPNRGFHQRPSAIVRVCAECSPRGHSRHCELPRPGFHASTFLPPVPQHGFAFRTCGPDCDRGTMKALTPAPVHRRGRSPRLPRCTVLPFRLQPRRALRYRFIHHASLPDPVTRLRLERAGSPLHAAESSSSSCGPTVRLRLLSTPSRDDAVTFGYGAVADSDTDLHRADTTPSRAHSFPRRREPNVFRRKPLAPRLRGDDRCLSVICTGLNKEGEQSH